MVWCENFFHFFETFIEYTVFAMSIKIVDLIIYYLTLKYYFSPTRYVTYGLKDGKDYVFKKPHKFCCIYGIRNYFNNLLLYIKLFSSVSDFKWMEVFFYMDRRFTVSMMFLKLSIFLISYKAYGDH